MSRTSSAKYQRLRKKTLAESDVCHICGGWINPEFVWPHPESGTFDHLDPVSTGGDNLGAGAAAHWGCNLGRQAKSMDQIRQAQQPKHGRQW